MATDKAKSWLDLSKKLGIPYNRICYIKNNDPNHPKTYDVDTWKSYLSDRDDFEKEVEDDSISSNNLEKLRFYKAERERLLYEKEKGLLVPLEAVQEDERKRWSTAKKHLLRLPTLAGKLHGMTAIEIQRELLDQVEDVLRMIAEEIKQEVVEGNTNAMGKA
jgi:hypothetical protein